MSIYPFERGLQLSNHGFAHCCAPAAAPHSAMNSHRLNWWRCILGAAPANWIAGYRVSKDQSAGVSGPFHSRCSLRRTLSPFGTKLTSKCRPAMSAFGS